MDYEKIKKECLDTITENMDDREFDQILNKADSISNPLIRIATLMDIAKISSKYNVVNALYSIRRMPMYRYQIALAELAYELANNGNGEASKVIIGCMQDESAKASVIENISEKVNA